MKKKLLPFIEIMLTINILILFITAHLLHTIVSLTVNLIYFGIHINGLIVDLVFYIAIVLCFILIILLIKENYVYMKRGLN